VREVRIFERGGSGLGLPYSAQALRVPRVRSMVQRSVWDVHRKLEGRVPEADLRTQGDRQGCSINSISKDLPHTYKTACKMAITIREAIYQRREEWREVLTGEVEASGRSSGARPARPYAAF